MVFHEMNSCVSVDDYHELENELKRIKTDPCAPVYPQKNVKRLINSVVYGGASDMDVLGEYVKTIQQIVNLHNQS